MITNLEIRDETAALAFGQKFDVWRVLEGMIGFIRGFAAEVAAADPDARPTARFAGDGDLLAPLDEDVYARLRRETIALSSRWDVATFPVRIDVGPFSLRTYPLGRDDLQRYGGLEPTTIDEGDWRDLDPTPIIEFLPSKGFPLFSDRAIKVVKDLVIRHAPEGAKPDFDRIPALRFPHHAFGIGLGTLRISLLTIPVEP
ncbi:MAG TPA: hypothetical protein VL283_05525 [Candidatus Baltobacteraceae bacterium]|nr:hypothetical protein [Candidatus Baltobacteraceae bacterium]